MQALPRHARVYIIALLAVAAFVVLTAVVALSQNGYLGTSLLTLMVFSLGIFLADLFPIVLPSEGNAEVTISCALKTAAVIICGPPVAILATLLGTLFAELTLQRERIKVAFNVGEMTVTTAAMAFVYQLFLVEEAVYPFDLATEQALRTPFGSIMTFLGVCAVILTYLFVNVGLVTSIVSLTTGASFRHVWRVNFLESSWNNLTIIPLGAVLASLWIDSHPWAIIALVLPMIVVRQSFQYIGEFQRQTRAALISMADAIDHRDPYTYEHSARVARISYALAEKLALPVEDIEMIDLAGRLHDLGKIGMNNTLLFKPGSFTEAERTRFQEHPVISAELVKSFHLFQEGQDIILHHHERYDGKGYPAGLAGEDIPLGSRILAVADSYDAMISRRVYRPALPLEVARNELTRNAGTQFDPHVVATFLGLLDAADVRIPVSESEPIVFQEAAT